MTTVYYNSNETNPNFAVVDSNWIAFQGTVDPATATPSELEAAGFYLFVESPDPTVDDLLEKLSLGAWVTTGTNASFVKSVTTNTLAEVKTAGTSILKAQLDQELEDDYEGGNFVLLRLIVEASRLEANRSADVQSDFDDLSAYITTFTNNVSSINAATTIAQVEAIVRP